MTGDLSVPSESDVRILSVHREESGRHPTGGWPEFTITLTYFVENAEAGTPKVTEAARLTAERLVDIEMNEGGRRLPLLKTEAN